MIKKIKIVITIVILSSISLYADKEEQLIPKAIIKTQLIEILENVKKYKKRNENEKERLEQQIDALKKEFKKYKVKKKREIAKINKQLTITKKELSKNRKKLRLSQQKRKVISKKIVCKEIIKKKILPKKKTIHKKIVRKKDIPKRIIKKRQTICKKIVRKRDIPKKNVRKKIVQKRIITKKKTLREKLVIQKPTPLPIVNNLPWVEIVVEDNINIYQLALKYYGDRQKYQEIYAANQQLIGKNLKIYNGMSLKIPINNQFEEQPMILNRD